MTNREKIIELGKMLEEYKEAEVITMVNEEACPYEYSSQMASVGNMRHDFYYLPDGNEYGLDEERIYFKSDNGELEDEIYTWAEDEGQKTEEEAKEIINSIGWNECIIVYIDGM